MFVPADPRTIGIPHANWRPHQRETVGWLWDNDFANARVLEAVTGSGKSGVALAMCELGRTVVLTRTKNLQIAYGNQYNAAVLFGKANYRCFHKDAHDYATAEDCLFPKTPHDCPAIAQCPYWPAKFSALEANFACLSYALFLAERGRWPAPAVLVMDEAHLLSDITLEHCGTTIKYKTALEWDLPRLPTLSSVAGGLIIKRPSPIPDAIDWLSRCATILERVALSSSRSIYDKERARGKEADRLAHNFHAVQAALDASDDLNAWFIRSGDNVVRDRNGSMEPGFICRPLTARYHFKQHFMADPRRTLSLLMSATIGEPATFTRELGISEYAFKAVPNQWPPESRPIYVLKDAPRMSHKATAEDFQKQAELIAKMLEMADPSWSGIIHVTRISEARLLGERLIALGYGDRVWVPESGTGTNAQVRAWHEHLRRVPNAICVTWALHEGYDGTLERINIIAKIPFPQRGDETSYENARANYDSKNYSLRTAIELVQMAGRTRRGEAKDYDTPTEKRGLVCVADGSIGAIKAYLPADIRDALVEI